MSPPGQSSDRREPPIRSASASTKPVRRSRVRSPAPRPARRMPLRSAAAAPGSPLGLSFRVSCRARRAPRSWRRCLRGALRRLYLDLARSPRGPWRCCQRSLPRLSSQPAWRPRSTTTILRAARTGFRRGPQPPAPSRPPELREMPPANGPSRDRRRTTARAPPRPPPAGPPTVSCRRTTTAPDAPAPAPSGSSPPASPDTDRIARRGLRRTSGRPRRVCLPSTPRGPRGRGTAPLPPHRCRRASAGGAVRSPCRDPVSGALYLSPVTAPIGLLRRTIHRRFLAPLGKGHHPAEVERTGIFEHRLETRGNLIIAEPALLAQAALDPGADDTPGARQMTRDGRFMLAKEPSRLGERQASGVVA